MTHGMTQRLNHRKTLFALATAAVLVTLGMPATTMAANIYVTSFEDNLTDDGLCTLREAVMSANGDMNVNMDCSAGMDADVIFLGPGDYDISRPGMPTVEDANLHGDIDITSDVTIIASPGRTTIEGSPNERYFDVGVASGVTTINVEIIGLSFTESAMASTPGGAIRVKNGAVLTLRDAFFDGVESTGAGAVLGIDADSVATVYNTQFLDNETTNLGGAVFTLGEASFYRCTFAGNQSSGGGAIHILGGTTRIRNSLFVANRSTTQGGAIQHNGTGLVVEQSTFSRNIGNMSGGAIATLAGDLDLSAVTFFGNVSPMGSAMAFPTTSDTYRARSVLLTHHVTPALSGLTLAMFDETAGNLSAPQVPGVQDLADNGGPTMTHALDADSTALGAGDCTLVSGSASTEDQRGIPRPRMTCDAGAFERRGRLRVVTSVEAPGDNCANGGSRIGVGYDDNDDGILQPTEIADQTYACDGPGAAPEDGDDGRDGNDGASGLVDLNPIPSGSDACPHGGILIRTGLDDGAGGGVARNGILEPGEVDSEEAICEAAGGCNASPISGRDIAPFALAVLGLLIMRRRASTPRPGYSSTKTRRRR